MAKTYLFTKNNYLKLQKSIKAFKNGQMLLGEKEIILKKKIEEYKLEEKKLKERKDSLLKEAEESLKKAIVDIGFEDLIDISNSIKGDDTIGIKYVALMGIEIPSVITENRDPKLNYGFYNTTIAVDESIAKFLEVKSLIVKIAEIDNTIIRLQKAIEKVQRRSNALKEVIIPREEALSKKIALSLEESERDEFIRLKVTKYKALE